MSFQLHPTLNEDSYTLGQFDLSRLLLINDNHYPWFVLVPQVPDIKEIYQLSEAEQQQLWRESSHLSSVVMDIFRGDKLNVAAIGNLVPQLHLHHVVRFVDDACWPSPVWGKLQLESYSIEQVRAIQQKMLPRLVNFEPASI